MKDQLNAARKYIDERLTEELTLDAIAAAAGYSRHHFARSFKDEFGMSVLTLRNSKSGTARRLLTRR